jgi:uncharacterized membrane protein YeaQ/YmgE (transglycosylase-associated protein family)
VAETQKDTVAGRVARFVFGAVGGAVSGWFYTLGAAGSDGRFGTIAVFAVVGGLMAMLLGRALTTRMFR